MNIVRGFRISEFTLAVFVIAIALLLLVPLPTPVLDILLVTNLSFAVVLLLTSLYIPNALALFSFPSILLLSTLFRLALNVASTRLILSQGEAGEVIRTFGTLLVGSEVLVGVVLFAIITTVNFIVVARGATRVSEVAARFALEAIPGKQLAIDADLRSGLITAEQAGRKRDELRKESQLYAAMDGAMKFVQGDVIAGILIIFINILGGLYIGTFNHGLSLSEAVQLYTTLTVGDGLVHQIPALLVSICAGIVVTRVSAGDQSTLGREMGAQLFSKPMTLLFAGALLIGIGTFTELPIIPFAIVGIVLIGTSYVAGKQQMVEGAIDVPARAELPATRAGLLLAPPQGETDLLDDDAVEIALDGAMFFRLYAMNDQHYRRWWRELQADFYAESGMSLPSIKFVNDELLRGSSFAARIKGVQIDTASLTLDTVLVEVNPEHAASIGIQVASIAQHPWSGERVVWAPQSPALRRIVEAGGLRIFDFLEYIMLRVAKVLATRPDELLSVAEVHGLLKMLEKKYPGLVVDAFGGRSPNVALLTEIVRELVRSKVSIKDFRGVIELIASYCGATNTAITAEESFDRAPLLAHVRRSRRQQLLGNARNFRQTVKVVGVSSEVQGMLSDAEILEDGSTLAMEMTLFSSLVASLESIARPVYERGVPPLAVVCRQEHFGKISFIANACSCPIALLTFDELEGGVELESVATWHVARV